MKFTGQIEKREIASGPGNGQEIAGRLQGENAGKKGECTTNCQEIVFLGGGCAHSANEIFLGGVQKILPFNSKTNITQITKSTKICHFLPTANAKFMVFNTITVNSCQ